MKFASLATAWLLVAIAVGASGALQRVRAPAPQIIIAGLTLALLAAWRKSARFGAWLDAIDLRALIALHLTRFVGLSFLLLCRRGELPCSFAVPAGSGDITVATFAAVLLLAWTHVD